MPSYRKKVFIREKNQLLAEMSDFRRKQEGQNLGRISRHDYVLRTGHPLQGFDYTYETVT